MSRLSQSRFGRSRFGASRFSGAVLGEPAPVIITGTAPVLAALEGGDTLSTAVTWGSYASSAGTIVDPTTQEMSVNGAAYVTYDGATVVAADDTYQLRETVTDSAANERVFVSAVVTVEAAVGPAGTITIDTLTYTRGAAGVAPTVATTVSSTGTTTGNYTLWGVLAATAQTKAQIDASPNRFSITAATLADLDGSIDLGNSATDGVISAYITDSSGSPIVSAVVTETGVTYDSVAPAFSSAEIGTVDATSLIVTLSKATYGSTSAADWDVQVNGSPATESAVSFTPGGTTVDITIGAAVVNGDTVTVAYTGTGLVGVDAEVVATFAAQSVTNNVAASSGPALVQQAAIPSNSFITSHNFTLPVGITDGNEIFVVAFTGETPRTVSSITSGYTEVTTPMVGSSNTFFYRKTASSDSGATLNITINTNAFLAVAFYELAAPAGTIEIAKALATDNPPEITPAFGSAEYLFMAGHVQERALRSVTALPSGYSDLLETHSNEGNSSTAYAELATAIKVATASSEDPGAFTYNAAAHPGETFTVAVR